MKNLTRLLALSVSTFALMMSCKSVLAQDGSAWGNMDPQQLQQMIQQRMTDAIRGQLAVTDDSEWNIIEGRLSKVIELKTDTMFSGLGGFRGMMGGRGGGQMGGRGGLLNLAQSSPESDALQSAIDSNLPADQLKSALDKFYEARKQKQAALTSAQDQLRQVLTQRQEAILALMGMLN